MGSAIHGARFQIFFMDFFMVFFMVKKNHLWRQVAGSPVHGARFQFRQCCCSSEVCLEFTVFRFRASNFDVVVVVGVQCLPLVSGN